MNVGGFTRRFKLEIPMRFVVLLLVFFAVPWLLLVAFAESHCPVIRGAILGGTDTRCGEGDGPMWFIAMVTAPIGGFAVLGLLLAALGRVFRR
jgi:hypothetical protein